MPTDPTTIRNAFLLATAALTACSSGDEAKTAELLAPPRADQGLQLQMRAELAPGVETERCRFFKVERDLYVNRQEVRFTHGSHHVLLYTTPYEDVPSEDRMGNAVDTTGVFECGADGPTAHWEIDGVAGGSQSAHGAPIVQGLPEDVAVVIKQGSILLMNTHYLNASDRPLATDARINLHTVPKERVTKEAGFIFFYNPFIRVPANARAEAREVCPVRSTVQVLNVQSHMHKRGVDFEANVLDAAGAKVGDTLYAGKEWEEVVMKPYAPARTLSPGQMIEYRCGYDNREARVVTQGLKTTDEMCMLLGLYYPRDRQFELCGLSDAWDGRFLGARWIGSGTATGAATAACFMTASTEPNATGDVGFYRCVVDSCPKINGPMSDAARCLATSGLGQCTEACKGDAAACRACVGGKCGGALQALGAASCE
jgi:hypothetical protein